MESIGTMKVRELMRPLERFRCISSDATFMEAVTSLEEADAKFKSGQAPERIVLVCEADERIIGKLSPIDVVKALEPEPVELRIGQEARYSSLKTTLASMNEQVRLWHQPLADLRHKAGTIKIRDFVKKPPVSQMVGADDDMNAAFFQFMVGRHGSLFVHEGGKIVGLILFSDLYRRIKERIKADTTPPAA